MKAAQLIAFGKPGSFELREMPEPDPGSGEALIQVQACGLNHLDLWLEEQGLPIKIELPRTPGGEVAGRITSLGPDSVGWSVGDRVAVQSNLFCGVCAFCTQGEESMCLHSQLLGVQRDGGFAEKVVAPVRCLVQLPASVEFDTSAALTLAGSTAMHMLTHRVSVRPANWVLVIGASSGVGSAAIQIAHGLGARVITTASSDAKKALALQLGAEHVVDARDPQWPTEVRRLTGKRGVDVIVEHVGGDILEKAFDCLARGGTIVTCGATAGRQITLELWPFFVKEQRLIGSYSRNKADLVATLQWVAQGRLKPVIDSVFPLARVAEAFARLRSREALGKVLVDPYGVTNDAD